MQRIGQESFEIFRNIPSMVRVTQQKRSSLLGCLNKIFKKNECVYRIYHLFIYCSTFHLNLPTSHHQ